jgi:hypothetical protein
MSFKIQQLMIAYSSNYAHSDVQWVTYLNIETGNRCLNIGGWYVFARRKGLKIYFFSTNSLNYVKYFLTIWWNKHRRFQCKENMTECWNFCKQLTLPCWTVHQLPCLKTVRLCTVCTEQCSATISGTGRQCIIGLSVIYSLTVDQPKQ